MTLHLVLVVPPVEYGPVVVWLARCARAGPGPGAAQPPPAALPALPPAAGHAPGPGTPRPLAAAPPAAPAASARRSPCRSLQGQRPGPRYSAAPLRRAPGPPPEVGAAAGVPDGQGAS